MLHLKTAFWGCTAALALAGVAQAEYIPVSLTSASYTSDLIAEGTATSPYTGASTSIGGVSGWVWYESRTGHMSGLPSSGSFTSVYNSNVTFQFQPYASNNATYVAVGHSATLTLTTATAFSNLAFLVSSQTAGSANVWTITLNYADGSNSGALSSTDGSTGDKDWTNSTSYTALATSVVTYNSSATWSSTYAPVNMIEHDWALTTAQQKPITSITINVTSGSGSITFFALDGVAVPEPATSAILLPGALLFFAWRRKQRRK